MSTSDEALLLALARVDRICIDLGIDLRDLRQALSEAAREEMVGIMEAAVLLDTLPRTLRRAIDDRTYSAALPAPVYTASPRGPLWQRSQVDSRLRAAHEKRVASQISSAIVNKPARQTRATPKPADTVPVEARRVPWEEGAAA